MIEELLLKKDTWVSICAKDPGDFESGSDYQIYNREEEIEIDITREQFEELKDQGLIVEATSEWPVAIWRSPKLMK